jgi:PAS domain S-box-containing protein
MTGHRWRAVMKSLSNGSSWMSEKNRETPERVSGKADLNQKHLSQKSILPMQLSERLMPLRNDMSLFRQLTDALPFGVFVVGSDRNIEYWNHAAESITGYLSQETLGRRCDEGLLTHCDGTGTTACALHGPAAFEEGYFFAQHKAGHRVPVAVRIVPLRDEQGTVVALAHLFKEEKASPEALSWIDEADSLLDPALGIYSATTTERQLRSGLACAGSHFAAFLIRIEHLDALAKKHGTEMTRVAQRAVIRTVTRLLSVPHYLGRWDEASLLVLVPECGHAVFFGLAERLESIGSSCAITWWGDRIDLRVAVRGAWSEPGDTLNTFSERLQQNPSSILAAAGEL